MLTPPCYPFFPPPFHWCSGSPSTSMLVKQNESHLNKPEGNWVWLEKAAPRSHGIDCYTVSKARMLILVNCWELCLALWQGLWSLGRCSHKAEVALDCLSPPSVHCDCAVKFVASVPGRGASVVFSLYLFRRQSSSSLKTQNLHLKKGIFYLSINIY